MNLARVNMTPCEKGKIIVGLVESTGKRVEDIGEEYFGMKRRMSFLCQKAYRDKSNMTKKSDTIDVEYDIKKLVNAWEGTDILKGDNVPTPTVEHYRAVRALVKEATMYSKHLHSYLARHKDGKDSVMPEKKNEP